MHGRLTDGVIGCLTPIVPGTQVAIVGGGLVGALTALRLADAGLAVTVLERAVPGAEASSAAAGILAAQCESPAPGVLFDLALESRALHASLALELHDRVGADTGHVVSGTMEVAFDEAHLDAHEARFAWQRTRGLRVEKLTAREARTRDAGLGEAIAGALLFPDDSQVDPPRLVSAVAQAAERAGVLFRSGAYVRTLRVEGDRVTGVMLDEGALAADHVVIAAGAWSALVEGAQLAAGSVRPARGQIVELATRTPPVRSVLYGRNGYVVPRADGRVLCGSTLEFVGFRNEVTAGGVSRILAMALELVPALEHARFNRHWASFRPYTPDTAPIVGDGGLHGLTIATGHYRSGILLAPVTARLVCERVVGGAWRAGLEALDPSRPGVHV